MHRNDADREPLLSRTLFEDLGRGDFISTIRRELRELRDFMLTEERRKRLKQMHRVKSVLYFVGWLLKSLFLKLTPARRILLLLAFILFILRFEVDGSDARLVVFGGTLYPVSILILLLILMLELKDKLLARSELEAGRAVQEALMPERNPVIPGWNVWLFTRAANEVGGDLVDLIRVTEDRFGIVLADVAGKGLRAALLTAKLQATLRALATESDSPARLMERLNQIFHRDSLPSTFASVVYVDLRSNSDPLIVVNAGHLPPLLIAEARKRKVEKGGIAVGLSAGSRYKEELLTLERGEKMLLYSDGVTEAHNEAGEFYGEARLMGLIDLYSNRTPEELGTAIVSSVDWFIGEAKRHDDLSIVVLERS